MQSSNLFFLCVCFFCYYTTRAGEINFKVGHGTLKSIVGHHGWSTKKKFRILDALEWLKQ